MSTLPDSLRRKVAEEQPYSQTWTRELEVLLDPKIEARPLTLPGIGLCKLKDSNFVAYLVRRKKGNNPDYTRYNEMRANGYSNVTPDECEQIAPSMNVADDNTEITIGVDLVLMKAPKAIHYGALKFHQQRAIDMTNPRKRDAQDALMRSMNYDEQNVLNSTRTRMTSEAEQDEAAGRAGEDNSVRRGSPKWNQIAKDAREKGA
jgi:hypothetical protein